MSLLAMWMTIRRKKSNLCKIQKGPKKMSNLIKHEQSLPARESNVPVVVSATESITVTNGARGGQIVRVRAREMSICGNKRMVDPYELMRMIKNVTQTIGEYKDSDNAFGDFVVTAMRKARQDMVSRLSETFHIHWGIDDNGKTYFFM